MNSLIKRFKEDLQLAGYAKRSIQSYTSAVLRLQRFYNIPLDDITEEQLRRFLNHGLVPSLVPRHGY